MKVIAFAASNSKQSINKQLVTYAASLLENADVELLDLNDYELPLFSVDIEKEIGQPALAQAFLDKLGHADALVISLAEHNGNYSAARMLAGRLGGWWKVDWMPARMRQSFLRSVET